MNYLRSEGKLRIAFIYQVTSFWTSWDSLYDACSNDDRIEIKLFRIDGEQGDYAQMNNSEKFLEENEIAYEEFSYERVMAFKPDYMIYQTPYDKGHRPIETWSARFRKEGIRIVYIPYGIEISDTAESRYKHFSLSVVLNSFSIFVLSDSIKKEYDKYCVNNEAVKPLGLPRFDTLLKDYKLPDFYRDKINGRKIILWKSHFPKIFIEDGVKKQATPELEEYLEFIDYIRKATDLFFVFMPHPKYVDETIDESLLPKAKRLLEEIRTLNNAVIDTSSDYRYSLMNADAIIVDRSAVMVEAGVKGVPVLYMYNEHYKEPMPEPVDNLIRSYYQGTKKVDMIQFCEMIKSGTDPKKDIRVRAFKECVPYTDGMCAKRIVDRLVLDATYECANDMVCKIEDGARIVIFCAGAIGGFCIDRIAETKSRVNILGFADNNSSKWNEGYMGYPVFSPSRLNEMVYDYVVIATDKYYLESYKQLMDMGISTKRLINFDQFIILMRH